MSLRALISTVLLVSSVTFAQNLNAFGTKRYTIESPNFRIHYTTGLADVARETGDILESFYEAYRNNYQLTLPGKTDVILINNDMGDGWADPFSQTIAISASEIDFPLRGSHDWLRDVLAHEYAHIVSINAGLKTPSWILGLQLGYFTHPNSATRTEAFHLLISENLPRWASEGVAQYESSIYGADSWDTHRDMILRSLTLSKKLLPYDQMCVFAGKLDDAEKTYNQGFSMTIYIAQTYGRDKLSALFRESAKPLRLDFDGAVKAVLGISARQLYEDWKKHLETRYKSQIDAIGPQVYGRKINKDGFHNYYPRFSPDEKKIFFTSNGKREYSFYKGLHTYDLSDTVKEDDRIKFVSPFVRDFYSIHDSSGSIAFSSFKSRKSTLPSHQGGIRTRDVFIDTLPPEKKRFNPFRKTERQISEKKSLFTPAFSPKGDILACAQHGLGDYYLTLVDTASKKVRRLYPDGKKQNAIKNIYAIDWSPDGRKIAVNYIDANDRKIGIFDTTSKEFLILCDTPHDERDPRFSYDGKYLYFSSDRTGIFNIYRYEFASRKLEQLTNVSGGAFSPDPSRDNKRLVFANYDASGFGIYLLDSIRSVRDTVIENPLVARTSNSPRALSTTFSSQRSYVPAPTKGLLVPTIFMEEAVSNNDDPFTGRKTVKVGANASASDPLGINTIGLALFIDPSNIHKFIRPDQHIIGAEVDYDLAAYGETKMLPITLSMDIMLRGITGYDWVYDAAQETSIAQRYGLRALWLSTVATHAFSEHMKVHALGGYNHLGVYMLTKDLFGADFPYTPAQGFRVGGYFSMLNWIIEPAMTISPNGLYVKLGYNLWDQRLMTEENGLIFEDGKIRENYDRYGFHEARASIKFGAPVPWHEKHDLYVTARTTVTELTQSSKDHLRRKYPGSDPDIPSFFQPAEWIPGYTYYYQTTGKRQESSGDSAEYHYDTALVSGNAVSLLGLSYRFPLWPGMINRKIGFIYFDKLYGALNAHAGGGWPDISAMINSSRNDWLLSAGAELRLEALSFNMLPLAVSFAWDRGLGTLDRKIDSPLGGDRFTFKLGFSFDDWELIDLPDYFQSPRFGRGRR